MKKTFLLSVLLGAFAINNPSTAQVVRNFTPRYSTDTKGRLVLVSNSIIASKTGSDGAPGYTLQPPSCTGTGLYCKNDGQPATNIDIDTDPGTRNSSAASLSMPDCSSVAFAGLYWGAGIAISQENNGATPLQMANLDEVWFKIPNGTYQTVTASHMDRVATVFDGYQAYADVTSLVRQGGNGYYTVANVKCDTVNSVGQALANAYGGWTMVVIYRDSTLPLRNMTVFDGLAVVANTTGNKTRDITVSGFKCPPSGVVNAKIGVVVYDGDRGADDGFSVRKNSTGTFTSQITSGESAATFSGSSDAWNSSITDTTSLVPARIPAYQNTMGYDAHQFKLNNTGNTYLRNNDTEAAIRISTSSEGYVLGLMTSEIDTYMPELILENNLVNLNGGAYYPGDVLEVTSTVRNAGTDVANGVRVQDQLPVYFEYVPGSLTVEGVPQTDASGDDDAQYDASTSTITAFVGQGRTPVTGGNLLSAGDSYTLTYRMTISEDCNDIGVMPAALLQQSRVLYTGQSAGLAGSTASRPRSTDPCILPIAPDTAYLFEACGFTLPVKLISFTARKVSNGNHLRWTVEEHFDGSEYIVERSFNGRDFSAIHQLPVLPREGQFTYTFTDLSATASSRVYYRLRLISTDGAPSLSQVIAIQATALPNWLELLPNPAANRVSVGSNMNLERIEFYSIAGVLAKTVVTPLQTIDVSALPPGIYVVKAYGGSMVLTGKLVKH